MEVTGRIEVLGVDEKVSNAFVKREVVVQTDEQHPKRQDLLEKSIKK